MGLMHGQDSYVGAEFALLFVGELHLNRVLLLSEWSWKSIFGDKIFPRQLFRWLDVENEIVFPICFVLNSFKLYTIFVQSWNSNKFHKNSDSESQKPRLSI